VYKPTASVYVCLFACLSVCARVGETLTESKEESPKARQHQKARKDATAFCGALDSKEIDQIYIHNKRTPVSGALLLTTTRAQQAGE